MEKQFQLDQRESAQLGQMEQERTQALAMVGALTLDMDQAKKQLDTALERQRMFMRAALANRGVDRYENARLGNGSIIAVLPDDPPVASSTPPQRTNGMVIDAEKIA